ncbi:RagB/SusD family nutrient uptake outer membrane protein [Adhaeribacter arboris]|uniref:RagB/SusD family nutrient uptake outer membrane protein n=1 Tax=Adhaeribacter arboris TaxID=2072846 RepID=A0A2T2YDF7_9BACT|nr:RagB/SusD family nutrient uptake outer membrane protein [Adhaeribacter arboris]PSR53541.1 RagB/SusD family nutrient uptake outer membrane protein [Adhaeribacter arboris]
MKRTIVVLVTLFLLVAQSCKDYLDFEPKGVLSTDQLNTPEEVDKMVIAAYASLSNDFFLSQMASVPWIWGSVRSDDAYKGGGGTGDNFDQHIMETFNLLAPTNGQINDIWIYLYENLGRANDALRRMESLTEAEYPALKMRQAECRFLRAHWHFILKILYKNPVWVDASLPKTQLNTLTNVTLTDEELWNKIVEDFQFVVDNLPLTQQQVGRASKVAAWAYLAKTRLYQAYEQDENNNVTNINQARLQEVVTLCQNIINSGGKSLAPDFAENFLCGFENGPESIFSVQYSQDDGTQNGKIQLATGVAYNMAPQFGCCDFLNPSYTMLNAFKTDPATGLPMMETYNNDFLFKINTWANVNDLSTIDFMSQTVDPRMDHTIGIPTHPWKYDPDFVANKSWRRVPEVYGYLTSMKALEHYNSSCFVKLGPFMGTSRNADLIRYDDVLLWLAESYIELGQQNLALPLINQIRERAANSAGRLVRKNGSPISNYKVSPYINGVNCNWTQDFARKALQWERRLEFSTEGVRFFDLVRWGIAAETLNAYFAKEKTTFGFLKDAFFKKNRDEYFPIPQAQINFSQGLYKQNKGW